MAKDAWVRVLRLGLAVAFWAVASGMAFAGDKPQHAAVIGFLVGLRQTVSESGARAFDQAAQWLSKLDLGNNPAGKLHPGVNALALGAADSDLVQAAADTVQRPTGLGLQAWAAATVISGDRGWFIGHAQSNLSAEIGDDAVNPTTYLTANLSRGAVVGSAVVERSFGGHDLELGLPMPAMTELHVTAARYWWGDRAFLQPVEGYRVGLSYDLTPHLQFEGGRSDDQVHGSGGFFGLHYSLPLDIGRPPGVMPR